MRSRTFLFLVAALAVATTLGGSVMAGDGPGVGDAAPEFSLPGSDGKSHSLSDHVGERAVVIAWFPKAFTGG